MLFQEAFPELSAQPPTLPGQQRLRSSPLHQLRRQQLHDLARAFGVEVKQDGTKEEILPILIDAEARGVFRGPPLDEWWLRKAARSSDTRGEILEGQPKSDKVVPVEEIETNYTSPIPIENMHIGRLRKFCKERGMIQGQQVSKHEMLHFLRETGVDVTKPVGDL